MSRVADHQLADLYTICSLLSSGFRRLFSLGFLLYVLFVFWFGDSRIYPIDVCKYLGHRSKRNSKPYTANFVPVLAGFGRVRHTGSMLQQIFMYVRECVRKTIELQERSRQMLAFLVAVLALPLFLLFGAKFEPSPEGAMWFALWTSCSALLTIFVLAPFHLWRDSLEKKLFLPDTRILKP